MFRSTKNSVSRSRRVFPTLEALEERRLMSTAVDYMLRLDGVPGEASTHSTGGGGTIADPERPVYGYKWRRPPWWPRDENPADGHLLMQPTNPIQIKIEEAVQVVSAVAKKRDEPPPSLVQGKFIQAEVVAHIFAGGADQAVVKVVDGHPVIDPAGPLVMKATR